VTPYGREIFVFLSFSSLLVSILPYLSLSFYFFSTHDLSLHFFLSLFLCFFLFTRLLYLPLLPPLFLSFPHSFVTPSLYLSHSFLASPVVSTCHFFLYRSSPSTFSSIFPFIHLSLLICSLPFFVSFIFTHSSFHFIFYSQYNSQCPSRLTLRAPCSCKLEKKLKSNSDGSDSCSKKCKRVYCSACDGVCPRLAGVWSQAVCLCCPFSWNHASVAQFLNV
jgi:hypothetical protein